MGDSKDTGVPLGSAANPCTCPCPCPPHRASWRSKLARRTAPQGRPSSRGALCVWSSITSSSPPFYFDAMGTVSVGLDVFGWRCAVCVFQRFRFSAPQNAKEFWPRRGARSQGSELVRQTRKNRPPAELREPAERLASCSRSNKSAIYRSPTGRYPLISMSSYARVGTPHTASLSVRFARSAQWGGGGGLSVLPDNHVELKPP